MVTQEYYVGVDLGQKKSYTAIAVVERRADRVEIRNPVTCAMEMENVSPPRLLVRHLERVPLGTSYVDVVDRVREMVWSNELRGRTKLVVDLLRRDQDFRQRSCELNSVTITGGTAFRKGPKRGEWTVPKAELINGLVLMFEEDRLEISRGLSEAKRLVEELVQYGKDEGFQDDLVLALSLATWRLRLDYDDPPEDGGVKVRKGPMMARERQQADEFVGMIMGVAAKRFR